MYTCILYLTGGGIKMEDWNSSDSSQSNLLVKQESVKDEQMFEASTSASGGVDKMEADDAAGLSLDGMRSNGVVAAPPVKAPIAKKGNSSYKVIYLFVLLLRD